MASTTANISTTVSTSTTSATATPSSTAPFALGNISHILQIKLDRSNYLLWKAQFLPLFRLHDYLRFVDGSYPCPSSTLTFADNATAPNPDYVTWQHQDQLILCCILSTLSKSVFSHVVGLNTSHAVWLTLEKMFAPQSQARIMQLEFQLRTLKKGSLSMADYVLIEIELDLEI